MDKISYIQYFNYSIKPLALLCKPIWIYKKFQIRIYTSKISDFGCFVFFASLLSSTNVQLPFGAKLKQVSFIDTPHGPLQLVLLTAFSIVFFGFEDTLQNYGQIVVKIEFSFSFILFYFGLCYFLFFNHAIHLNHRKIFNYWSFRLYWTRFIHEDDSY